MKMSNFIQLELKDGERISIALAQVAIVTGYAPFGNVSPSWDIIDSYEKRAIAIDSSNLSYENKKIETKKLLEMNF